MQAEIHAAVLAANASGLMVLGAMQETNSPTLLPRRMGCETWPACHCSIAASRLAEFAACPAELVAARLFAVVVDLVASAAVAELVPPRVEW